MNCPDDLLQKLQRLQNNAARLVLRTPRRDHMTPHLFKLHWLPVESRIMYKIACICFQAINGTGPAYLSELLHIYTPARSLRSESDPLKLCTPRTSKPSFGDRSFAWSGPSIWNELPLSVRSSTSYSAFRSALKTHLFKKAFSTE